MADHELDDDDPVVKEVDVFLNKPVGAQVYVLQVRGFLGPVKSVLHLSPKTWLLRPLVPYSAN